MKYKIIISLAILISCLQTIKSQQVPLTVDKVIQKFYSTYDVTSLAYPQVGFEKRKNEWYVRTIKFIKNKPVTDKMVLFYDGKKGDFVDLGITKNLQPVSINSADYMDEYTTAEYNLQPFQGYKGWYDDVISEYRNKSKLSDDELYALGRAYSKRAKAAIVDNAGDAILTESYNFPFGTDVFSASQLQNFKSSVDSGIEKFHQLYVRNPDYFTRVGKIRIKYANEIIDKFLWLYSFSEKESQKLVLPPGIYPDTMLNKAKAWLFTCPPHSILVSFSDNDFYPLLYLQKTEGFRRDVYLINYNLLGIDKFIYRATFQQFGEPGLKLNADTTIYKGQFNDYIYVKEGSSSVSTVDQLISRLRENANEDSSGYLLKADNISIVVKEDIKPGMVGSKQATISLKNVQYLYKNNWILLDIINNLGSRRIAFTDYITDWLVGLNPFLKPEGISYIYQSP